MSTIQDLITTLEDGRKGYAEAADKLSETGHTSWATKMRSLSEQRQQFSSRLQSAARGEGMEVDADGSALANLHRAWMTLKDMVPGDDGEGTLEAAISGEEHALDEYDSALNDVDIPVSFQDIIREQRAEIASAKAELEQMQKTAARM